MAAKKKEGGDGSTPVASTEAPLTEGQPGAVAAQDVDKATREAVEGQPGERPVATEGVAHPEELAAPVKPLASESTPPHEASAATPWEGDTAARHEIDRTRWEAEDQAFRAEQTEIEAMVKELATLLGATDTSPKALLRAALDRLRAVPVVVPHSSPATTSVPAKARRARGQLVITRAGRRHELRPHDEILPDDDLTGIPPSMIG